MKLKSTLSLDHKWEFDSVFDAIESLKNGDIIIICDDQSRENEGDLVIAAEFCTPKQITFLINNTSGILCCPLLPSRASVLNFPLMVKNNTDVHQTQFTVTVDHKDCSTGISAKDRCLTLQRIAALDADKDEFNRPGHVFPLIYTPGGTLVRQGHTEASVDCCLLAGLTPCAVISEIVLPSGDVARRPDLVEFSKLNGLKMISISDLRSVISHYADQGNDWYFE
eukprot:NODE_65_length_25825_cov_1.353844.p12 type:complete len:224 gc:universal NODE_65_length_25825_cov_1.353844:2313-1642(-)